VCTLFRPHSTLPVSQAEIYLHFQPPYNCSSQKQELKNGSTKERNKKDKGKKTKAERAMEKATESFLQYQQAAEERFMKWEEERSGREAKKGGPGP